MSGKDREGRGGQMAGARDETTVIPLHDSETVPTAVPFDRADSGSATGGAGSGSGAAVTGPGQGGPRGSAPRVGPRSEGRGSRPGRRRARLALTRVDPRSVFVLSLVVSLFLGVVLLVAVAVLYALLSGLGVLSSVNSLAQELDLVGEGQPLLGLGRTLGLTAVIAAVDIILLTVLATLGAFLYNLCAALTGGIEVTLSERD